MRIGGSIGGASFTAISLAALACATAASAQSPAPARPQPSAVKADSEEIVVTANRREQALFDVPAAVSAISGATLTSRGLVQIQDFATQVPGFSIETVGRTGVRLILRGQNTGGAGASVATMVDDVVLNDATANSNGSTVTPNFETFDLERIEVLRGPQGTLYGATAQGGLLKYVTNKPKLDKSEGAVEIGAQNVRYGETGYSAKGVINVPLSQGVAALRVMGFYNDVPGFIDNPTLNLKDVDSGSHSGVRASLLVKPSSALSVRLTAFTQSQDSDSEGLVDVKGAAPNAESGASFGLVTGKLIARKPLRESVEGKYSYYNAVVDYDFAGATLTSSTSYAKGERTIAIDATGTIPLAGASVRLAQVNDHDKFNQEFRLASRGDGRAQWQGGLFFSRQDVTSDQRITQTGAFPIPLPPPFPALPVPSVLSDSKAPAKYEEISGFGDATFALAEKFDLSLGVRYTSINQAFSSRSEPAFFNGGALVVIPKTKTDETKFTYSIAPRYEFSDDVAVYARIASGYRPGGAVSQATLPGVPKTFNPDNTVNYEVGSKGALVNGLLSYDVALYQIDWTDAQVLSSASGPAGPVFFTGNAGEARSRGFEWSFGLTPAQGLTLGWNGAYTEAELTQSAPGIGGAKGDALPFVPKTTSALNVDYARPVGETTVTVGASWTRVGERFGAFNSSPFVSNHPRLPKYDTIDLRAGVAFSRYKLDALVRNASDEQGITSYRNGTGFVFPSGQADIITPRTFVVRASASF